MRSQMITSIGMRRRYRIGKGRLIAPTVPVSWGDVRPVSIFGAVTRGGRAP